MKKQFAIVKHGNGIAMMETSDFRFKTSEVVDSGKIGKESFTDSANGYKFKIFTGDSGMIYEVFNVDYSARIKKCPLSDDAIYDLISCANDKIGFEEMQKLVNNPSLIDSYYSLSADEKKSLKEEILQVN